jgi:hypothetical protein
MTCFTYGYYDLIGKDSDGTSFFFSQGILISRPRCIRVGTYSGSRIFGAFSPKRFVPLDVC